MFHEGQGGRFFTAGDAQSLRRIASDLAADPLAVMRLAQGIPHWPNWMEVTAAMLRQLDLLVQKGRGARSDCGGEETDGSGTAYGRSVPARGVVWDRGAPMVSGSPASASLVVSIVTYGGDLDCLGRTFAAFAAASEAVISARGDAMRLFLVDNGPRDAERSATLAGLVGALNGRAEVIAGHDNIGYGRGHNLAIGRSNSRYHLVLNPDVELAPDALVEALTFMDTHPDCGLLAPEVRNEFGDLQYLCKRYPTVFDLLLRGFAPRWIRERFRARLDRYEMRDLINDHDPVWDPPIISGCFMLFRTDLFKAVGEFDPRYFLYFEDFDLSLRAARVARIAYVPKVRIVHHGGDAARKGPAHMRMFVTSAAKFFRQHGWRWA